MRDKSGFNSPSWRKSSYSMSNGQCIETAQFKGQICVRDSIAAEKGPTLHFTATAWTVFTAAVRTM